MQLTYNSLPPKGTQTINGIPIRLGNKNSGGEELNIGISNIGNEKW